MDQEWSVPGWAVLATLLGLAVLVGCLVVALLRTRARATAAIVSIEAVAADAAALRSQVEAVERRLAEHDTAPARVGPDEREYVITRLGDAPEGARTPAPVVDAPVFADLVLRESVVQAASLAAGLRRALAPETRLRIRSEMRREVKRARKQRRAELRDLRRRQQADERAAA